MDGYFVRISVFRKGEISPLDVQITDLSEMNLSGCEIEEFVENTVDEDRLTGWGDEDE